MNRPNLFLHIDALHHLQTRPIPLFQRRPVVSRRSLLASRELLLRKRLARGTVEEVAALAG